jgi:rhamnogalacturonan endolyase
MRTLKWFARALMTVALLGTVALRASYQLENLGRGIVAVRTGSSSVYLSWRLLGNDPANVGFNVYRGTTKINASPITATTDLVDTGANLTLSNTYTVRAVVGGVEGASSGGFTLAANAPVQQYLSVKLQVPAGGTTPDGVAYTYSANDCSVADLDGDGEYEFVVKWDPSNSRDNSQSGYTGNVYLDAYKLNGTRLWRIDLGRNIRAGAHYTQFMVYDLDGDGKAEVICKTADGTVSGTGQLIGSSTADYRNTSGYVLSGPEYQTVFNGQTGAILATVNYNPARGTVSDWGDSYGNRVDRFVNCVAYVDGQRPSVIMGRGYYTRLVRAAWDWRNGAFTQRWVFDSNATGNGAYAGQGNHQLSVGDVDGDGKDEICNGASAINDSGTGLYAPGLGHGDTLHMTVIDPSRGGQQVWQGHEDPSSYGSSGEELKDAKTGATIWAYTGTGGDIGRACCGDVDPNYPGAECWGPRGGLFTNKGVLISSSTPAMNFMVWWDADLLRETLDGTTIAKWDYTNKVSNTLLAPAGVSSNNSTKATPCLSGDILGDWREEVVWRASDSSELRIYTTTIPATNRLTTLMHDRQYRLAIAWQNTAYNQPPHPSFYLGTGMSTPPAPKAYYVSASGCLYPAENGTLAGTGTVVETTNTNYNGTGYVNFPTTGGSLTFSNVNGGAGGTKTLAIRYSNGGTATRTGTLVVNGVSQSITFNVTSSWTTWAVQNVTVSLTAGAKNTIQLNSTGNDLANIDEITVQ